EHHQSTTVNYMRFARYQRGQRLRAVDACFEDLKDSRLVEDTFTADEVSDMLDGLLAVVRGEVESELINTAHTNVLLLRQVFQQAEKWHLKLQADISELENSELLEKIANFEDAEFSGASPRDSDFSILQSKLAPLNESGSSALLSMEIDRLKEENLKLKDRLKQVESKALGYQDEKSRLKDDLKRTQEEMGGLKGRKPEQSTEELEQMRKQMENIRTEMDKGSKSSLDRQQHLESDLTGTKHELLRIREMLELAEKDLEKKVSQTAPFKNLKQMLQKKNEQIKDLRKRLGRYEGDD
ncbi:unnamed protein product, partial [Owenia fusiformis]